MAITYYYAGISQEFSDIIQNLCRNLIRKGMYIMREGKKRNKIVSLVLAAFMMVSVFAVATPQQAEAAGELSLKGKGT